MTDYAKWFVGMKVVFIIPPDEGRVNGREGYGNETDPVYGHIYTIRELGFEFDVATLRLVEIVNPPNLYRNSSGAVERQEIWYACSNFRPLEERKTDISIFTRLLQPEKEKA